MADTLTINLAPDAAAALRELADEAGQTMETLAQRLLEEAALGEQSASLSEAQVADLRERARNPSALASPERTRAILGKFGLDRRRR